MLSNSKSSFNFENEIMEEIKTLSYKKQKELLRHLEEKHENMFDINFGGTASSDSANEHDRNNLIYGACDKVADILLAGITKIWPEFIKKVK